MSESLTGTYSVCGLVLRSEVPLPAPQAPGVDPDVSVSVGEPLAMPWQRPTADVLAELIGPDGWPRYSFCREADGSTRARFYAIADFAISADGRSVVCHTHPEVDEQLSAILLVGSVTAFLLTCRDHFVLHASAVEVETASAVAFVGPTGRGKSTTAALLCARGLPLITDDVLPVLLDGSKPRCRPAANEIRLRTKQADLITHFTPPPNTRMTADGRLAVRPATPRSPEAVIEVIVRPLPVRGGERVELRRLSSGERIQVLCSATRIEGWQDPRRIVQVFDQAAEIASKVPVIEAAIPWGPPFPKGLIDDLIERLDEVRAGVVA